MSTNTMTVEPLSPDERKILELHRIPKRSGLTHATRLSIQYLIAAGIFTYLAVADRPWFAIASYLIFVLYVAMRLVGARRLANVMPAILAKYEARIGELEVLAESQRRPDETPT